MSKNNSDNIHDVIREEYKRCAADVLHFIKKFCIIQHSIRGKIQFKLYDFQSKTLLDIIKHRYNIIAKGRQLGMSTVVAAYALWRLLFTSDYKILIIATTQDVAKELLSKVQLMYDNLPSWLKATARQHTDNKLELSFNNGSSIRAVSSSEKSARSPSISLLIIDEAAFIDNFEDIWTAAQATLSTGGAGILLSSANGASGKFYEIWTQATEGGKQDGMDPFNPILLPWYVHPERDQKWADEQKAKLGPRKFAQEHSVDFLTSGHTVIDGEVLQRYLDTTIKDPIERRYAGDLWIWKYPDYSKSYVVSADVARGDGADNSAFHVIEVGTDIQCATFKSKIDTRDYGRLLVTIGTEYNNALLVVDNHSMGWDVIQTILDARYSNLYYSHKSDPFYDENIHLRNNIDLKNKKDMTPGFTSSTKTRMNMISKLESNVGRIDSLFGLNCVRTLNELKTFMWINGKAQADKSANDDLVMALTQYLYVKETALRMHASGLSLSRLAVKNMHKSVYTPRMSTTDMWQINTGDSMEDVRWLNDRRR